MSDLLIAPGAEFPVADEDSSGSTHGYLVVIEAGDNGWGAYVPDLPGVVAAAETRHEVEELIADAVAFHLDGLRDDGMAVPEPVSTGVTIPARHVGKQDADA